VTPPARHDISIVGLMDRKRGVGGLVLRLTVRICVCNGRFDDIAGIEDAFVFADGEMLFAGIKVRECWCQIVASEQGCRGIALDGSCIVTCVYISSRGDSRREDSTK
jgi:hypothetical protein